MISAAAEVFVDVEAFRTAFLAAMNEASNGSIAALCKELRTEPQSIGALKNARGFLLRRARPAEMLTKALRAEIVAARNLLNSDRAERASGEVHLRPGTADLGSAAPVLPSTDRASRPPPISGARDGRGEAEKPLEAADIVTLVADVGCEAMEWAKDVKAAVASTVAGEKRAEFAEDVERLEASASLFQDTPDDLHELL